MEQELDGFIEQLVQCKQLSEDNVKKLCDKVSPLDKCGPSDLTCRYAHLNYEDARDFNGGV